MSRSIGRLALLLVAAACVLHASTSDSRGPAPDTQSLIRQAFDAGFSLDYPEAHAAARRAVELDPSSSAAHRMAAWVAWNHVLYLRGAVSVDYYMGGVTKSLATLPKPPADLEAEFHRELDRAIAIADQLTKRDGKDVTAEYDLGAAYGLQASYAASVEGRMNAAFGAARHAYEAHERVLGLAPSRVDAGVIVGTYRYVVASFSMPLRMFAYVAGFGGGKEKGIQLLESAAQKSAAPEDAQFALVMIYSREHRDADALRMIRVLEHRYPRNRLLVLEDASTLIRGGKANEAEPMLSAGLARLGEETRPLAFGERALWLYKRGAARVMLGRHDAEHDLTSGLAAGGAGWVNGRLHLELGKLADVEHDRPKALSEYRQAAGICRENADALCQSEADRHTQKPFARGE